MTTSTDLAARIADIEETVRDLQARCLRYEAAMLAAAGALSSSAADPLEQSEDDQPPLSYAERVRLWDRVQALEEQLGLDGEPAAATIARLAGDLTADAQRIAPDLERLAEDAYRLLRRAEGEGVDFADPASERDRSTLGITALHDRLFELLGQLEASVTGSVETGVVPSWLDTTGRP